jgi:exosortase/archaeosortase family protein
MQIGIKNNIALWFSIRFVVLFLMFYYFNILYFGLTSPGGNYIGFLDKHLNYIDWLRWLLLHTSGFILNALGFTAKVGAGQLMVVGHGIIALIYTCLGLGVMSFFTAFVIAYPKKLKPKLIFLVSGLLSIQILNIIRLMLLALYWNKNRNRVIDHHIIFDVIIYIIILAVLYKWVNHKASDPNAAN